MNKTAYISHRVCLKHDNGSEHPESPKRLLAIDQQLKGSALYQDLECFEAPKVNRE